LGDEGGRGELMPFCIIQAGEKPNPTFTLLVIPFTSGDTQQ